MTYFVYALLAVFCCAGWLVLGYVGRLTYNRFVAGRHEG